MQRNFNRTQSRHSGGRAPARIDRLVFKSRVAVLVFLDRLSTLASRRLADKSQGPKQGDPKTPNFRDHRVLSPRPVACAGPKAGLTMYVYIYIHTHTFLCFS